MTNKNEYTKPVFVFYGYLIEDVSAYWKFFKSIFPLLPELISYKLGIIMRGAAR